MLNHYLVMHLVLVLMKKCDLMSKIYTDEFLISEFHRFIETHGRVPKSCDMNPLNGYPSITTYLNHFKSWNEFLISMGIIPKHIHRKRNKYDTCDICGTTNSRQWNYNGSIRICRRCNANKRDSLYGTLNPKSLMGIGTITEHVVYEVLKDCIKCNTSENYSHEYDLISDTLGTINVKSSILHIDKGNKINWRFRIHEESKIPNFYICIAFNEDRSNIEHVWKIPGNIYLTNKSAIFIARSKTYKMLEYEIDSSEYNNIYKNLNIKDMPQFKNLDVSYIDLIAPNIHMVKIGDEV